MTMYLGVGKTKFPEEPVYITPFQPWREALTSFHVLLIIFLYAGLPIAHAGVQPPDPRLDTPDGAPHVFEENTGQPPAGRSIAGPTLTGRIIAGRIINLAGSPIRNATIRAATGRATSDASGHFQLPAVPASAPVQWVTVDHPDYLPRTRAAKVGEPVLLRLTPDDGHTVAVFFGGDTMFGRRYYDPNEDGNTEDGLLPPGPNAKDHLNLLQGVRPLLSSPHITVLNLETPLAEDPWYDHRKGPRPAGFDPNKSITFATHVSAARALAQSGVDVVDLANNHIYDMLDPGVANTLSVVEKAGLLQTGAGMTETGAWRPAVITEAGQTFAFLACGATRPDDGSGPYASDEKNKGGAARCREDDIRRIVAKTRARYDHVILMIHTGKEYYRRHPNDKPRRLTAIAREAGVTLVINHGAHITGGFDWDGRSLAAWGLGNFAFDQNYWMTFQSYLLTVHLRRGKVIRAYADPLMIEGYLPKAVAGGFADYMAREAAGREFVPIKNSPFVVEDGAMESDFHHRAARKTSTVSLDGGTAPGRIFALPRAQWVSGMGVSGTPGPGAVRLGRDLIWTGSFERDTMDETSPGGALWRLAVDEQAPSEEKRNLALYRPEGKEMLIGPGYARTGERGIRLRREAEDGDKNGGNAILTLIDRIQMPPATRAISVAGWLRADRKETEVALSVYWYDTRYKSSIGHETEELTVPVAHAWIPFQVHLTVPEKALAVKPFLRLMPAGTGAAAADFDDIRLIAWAPGDAAYTPLYDHVRVTGRVDLEISQDILPGAEDWVGEVSLVDFGSPR